MDDQIYADTYALSSFSDRIRGYCEAILQASHSFYKSTTAITSWSDDLTDRAVEHYAAVAGAAERILRSIDGCETILKRQLEDLADYERVSI